MSASGHEIDTFQFADDGRTPNHPRFPVIFYRAAFPGKGNLGDAIERCFRDNGWRGTWRWGVYPFHHYHCEAHEVLGCARGEALIRLGGENGTDVRLTTGDAVLLPAGTGHCCLQNSSDFQIVGAYPPGQSVDLVRSGEGDIARARERILEVPLPSTDPVAGPNGPLHCYWGKG